MDLATGRRSEFATGLGSPVGVALDGSGHAFVVDRTGGRLQEVDLATGRVDPTTGGLGTAQEVRLDGEGHAYVVASDSGKMYSVNLTNGRKSVVTDKLNGPSGLALNGRGHAYVVENDGKRLREVNLADGGIRDVAEGDLPGAWGVDTDGRGNLYVTDDHHVWRVNEGGTPPPPPGPKVEVRQVEGGTAVPGGDAVPKVTVTNRSADRIGRQDVTLTLGPGGLKWLGYHDLYTSRDGGKQKFPCDLSPNDPKKAVCSGVDLDLGPGGTVELRTIVGTES